MKENDEKDDCDPQLKLLQNAFEQNKTHKRSLSRFCTNYCKVYNPKNTNKDYTELILQALKNAEVPKKTIKKIQKKL